jgi:hypothetical protein
MFALQETTQDPISLVPIALVAIIGAVVFWRTMIKIIVVGLILLVVLGLSEFIQSLR